MTNWLDYPFIRDEGGTRRVPELPVERTGWETVIFEIGDDDRDLRGTLASLRDTIRSAERLVCEALSGS